MQLGIVLIDGYEDDTPKQFLYIRGPDIELWNTDAGFQQDNEAKAYTIMNFMTKFNFDCIYVSFYLD